MGTINLNDKNSLQRFFDVLVTESVKKAKNTPLLREDYAELQREADDEREKQEKTKSAKADVESLFGDKAGSEEETGGEEKKKEKEPSLGDEEDMLTREPTEPDTSDAATKAAKAITVSQNVEGVVNLLNLIRSGRSLKDADILEELTTWVEEMSDAQKLFTVTILAGIKDIVTAGESAEEAEDPDESGVKVTMPEKEGTEQTRKAPGDMPRETQPTTRRRTPQVKSIEDTSAPIVVGHRTEAYRRAYSDKIKKLMGD